MESPPSKEEVFDTVLRSVCVVETEFNNGSGFIFRVEDNRVYVLTNHHVIKDASTAILRFFDSSEYDAVVLGFDVYHDVAVLLFENHNNSTKFSPLVIFDKKTTLAQEAFLIGNALSQGLLGFDGIVSSPVHSLVYTDITTKTTKRVPVIAITTPINYGCSGSAVFDKLGRVFAIATYQTETYNGGAVYGMNFAVPMQIAYPLANQIINENPKGEKLAENCYRISMSLMVSVEDESAYYVDFLGLNIFAKLKSGTLIVESVGNLDLSYGKTLEKGDKILSVGNVEIKEASLFDLFSEIYHYIDTRIDENVTSNQLKIKFERDGVGYESAFFNKYEKNY